MQSQTLRRHMVDSQLRTSGINEPWITKAMAALPRENFVGAERAAVAYADRPVPLLDGRMLNPPVIAGYLLQAAEPSSDDRALLIGAGTGYLAALLAPQVGTLIAIEENAQLAAQARQNVPSLTVVEAPFAEGYADKAPYSLIVIDGAIEVLPQALIDQLAEGGRIVTGLSEGAARRLAKGVKHGPHLALRAFADQDVAPIPGFAHTKEFVF